MKKLLTLFILAVFLLSFTFPVMAAEPAAPVSKNQAMAIAKEKINIPENMRLNSISYRYEENGTQVWSFNWNSGDPKKISDISVEIDAVTGKLRNFYSYSPDNYSEKNRYTLNEAREIAIKFLKEMNPAEYGQLRLEPPFVPEMGIPEKPYPASEYYFRFSRIVNGYPFWDNGVSVTVSGANGKVMAYNYNWDNGELPSVDNVVYLKEAKKIFNDKIGLDLGYLRIWNEEMSRDPRRNIVLGYYPRITMASYIDATTGEFIDYAGNPVTVPVSSNQPIGSEPAPKPLPQDLSMEEAMNLAKKWVDIPDSYKLTNAYYYENPQGVVPSTWNFSWSDTSKVNYGYISVGVNAGTGEITNIGTSYEPPFEPAEITEEQAKKAAVDFLKEIAPSRAGELRLDSANQGGEYLEFRKPGQNPPTYYFHFSRLVNGVPFTDNGVSVTVNGKGKVISYYSNWEDLAFPAVEGIIDAAKAAGLYMNQMDFEIGYAKIGDFRQGWKIRLVYRLNHPEFYIDAKTGELKNRWDGKVYYQKAMFSDIKGHWAEKEIVRLADNKIINTRIENPGDKLFKPDESISRGEVTAMLVKALELNRYYPDEPTFSDVPEENKYFGYIEAAFKAGIVKGENGKFRPESGITREEMAVILIKGLDGAGDQADLALDYFKDADQISEWAKDDVLAAARLGMLKGDEKGRFNPRKNVTRAEAAALIARVLDQSSR